MAAGEVAFLARAPSQLVLELGDVLGEGQDALRADEAEELRAQRGERCGECQRQGLDEDVGSVQ